MPLNSFFANGLWVLVLGLLGPSLPSIVADLGITYTQAGLFFTFLSFGSLLGTSLGAFATDHFNKKRLLLCAAAFLIVGLVVTALSKTYYLLLTTIFFMSLLGSPIGAISQSIMLSLFPEKRETYLSVQTFFAAAGSFLSPLIVTAVLFLGLPWRGSFLFAAVLGVALMGLDLGMKIKERETTAETPVREKTLKLLRDPAIILSALFVFLCIGPDIGFSYWLTEHYVTDLGATGRWASAVVTVYLVGVLISRGSLSRLLRKIRGVRILPWAAAIALAGFAGFVLTPSVVLKTVCVCVYGIGVGPIFPLLMAWGTARYPGNPGTVTGILFGMMSAGGMVFPLVIGGIAEKHGIIAGYGVNVAILVLFLVFFLAAVRRKGTDS